MQIKVFWRVLLRRWYLTGVACGLAVVGAVLAVMAVGPTYEAQSAVLLLPPSTTVRDDSNGSASGNPYLALGGLNQARDIVLRAMTSQEASDDLCSEQGGGEYAAMRAQLCRVQPAVTYEVTPDYTNSAPLILVSVKADTEENAMSAMRAVSDLAPRFLQDLQSDLRLAPSARITSSLVVADTRAEPVHKMQIRLGIVSLAVLLGLGLVAIALLDHFSTRRPSAVPAEDDAGWGNLPDGQGSSDTGSVDSDDGWWDVPEGVSVAPGDQEDRRSSSFFSRG